MFNMISPLQQICYVNTKDLQLGITVSLYNELQVKPEISIKK